MLINVNLAENKQAIEFCNAFLNSIDRPKYIFGRNEFAKSIANLVRVDGFVDDFALSKEYLGKPVCKTEAVPKDALVVSAVVLGRPLTAKGRLLEAGLEHLDYFSLYRYSGLALEPVTCWHDFKLDFKSNKKKYEWVFDFLSDEESRKTLSAIICFRLSYDLDYMEGFTDRQSQQYFEDFLNLSKYGEVFVDVGGYDGFTSLEFVKHCPGYKSVYFFEPLTNNMILANDKLSALRSIRYYKIALSDKKEVLRFSANGSSSRIDDQGKLQLNTEKLDSVISEKVSFIKIDVEGAEKKVLEGAKQTIITDHPKLAVCVYHRGDDFWKIPELILSYRKDYSIYLRHYTEGVDETVMYFIPD